MCNTLAVAGSSNRRGASDWAEETKAVAHPLPPYAEASVDNRRCQPWWVVGIGTQASLSEQLKTATSGFT